MLTSLQKRKAEIIKWLPMPIIALFCYLLTLIPEPFYNSVGALITYRMLLITCTILILLSLFFYFLPRLKRKELELTDKLEKEASNEKIIPTITDKSLFSDSPTVEQLRQHVESQPPYMQQQISKTYIGLRVHWILELKSVFPEENSSIVEIGFLPWIHGAIDTNDFPSIKIAPIGTIFDIWAEITEMLYPRIFLGIHMIEQKK